MKSRTKPALRAVPAAQVQLSLNVQGVLRDVQQAFYGLRVNAGKQVLAAMMEADRVALCGANNVPDASRKAVRGGTTRSSVVLGGQRIAIAKPRARSLQRGELALPTFAWAADTDPLDMATLASLAAGVSTRRYAGTLGKLPEPDEPPRQVQVAQRPREATAQAPPSHRAADRPHQGRPPDGSVLADGRRGRCAACFVLRGGLQHPLAAAGHRPSRPGGAFLRLVCDRRVCRRHADGAAGGVKSRTSRLRRRSSALAGTHIVAVGHGWVNFAGPTS
jgi:hypothetical protein